MRRICALKGFYLQFQKTFSNLKKDSFLDTLLKRKRQRKMALTKLFVYETVFISKILLTVHIQSFLLVIQSCPFINRVYFLFRFVHLSVVSICRSSTVYVYLSCHYPWSSFSYVRLSVNYFFVSLSCLLVIMTVSHFLIYIWHKIGLERPIVLIILRVQSGMRARDGLPAREYRFKPRLSFAFYVPILFFLS